jgi:hypothetical protein
VSFQIKKSISKRTMGKKSQGKENISELGAKTVKTEWC